MRILVDGSVWIITSQSVMRWDGRAWEVVLDDREGRPAAVDDRGQLWLLAQDASEISVWQDGKWIKYGAESGWTSEGPFQESWWATAPWSVYCDASGILWVPMEHDVRAFDGSKWKVYDLDDMGFPIQEMEEISTVHSLAMAGDGGEIWVGECYYSGPGPMGGGGLRWFNGQSWHGGDSPVGTTCISTITVDEMGDVWLGAYDSILNYKHTGQSWMEYRLPESLLSGFNFAYPQQLIVDQSGGIWVIMQMCGGASCDVQTNLYWIRGGEWSFVIDAAYWGSSFKQLVLDGNGQGWLFWEGMFYRLSDQPLELITSIMARGVDVSPDGKIWVVAGSGDETSLQVLEP